jgi:hypothetical protein
MVPPAGKSGGKTHGEGQLAIHHIFIHPAEEICSRKFIPGIR